MLVPITDRLEPGIILTQRSETLRRHPGQVAFPGGRIDPDDDGPIAAALREAQEEIGLPASAVEIIGIADRYRTVTGYEVTPASGGQQAEPEYNYQNEEENDPGTSDANWGGDDGSSL